MGLIYIFIASLLWATDTLIRYPLMTSGLSAVKIVFIEHLILLLCLIPFLYIQRNFWKSLTKEEFFSYLFIGGIGSALATLSFTKAFSLLNPSLVIVLQKLQPIVAISLARFFLKETVSREFLFWAFVCLLGGLFISYQDFYKGITLLIGGKTSLGVDSLSGYFFAGVAVLGWGASTVFGKKLSLLGHNQWHLISGRFGVGFICLLPIVFFSKEVMTTQLYIFNKLLIMVFLSGFLGMIFYYLGLKRSSARLTALAEMFFPLCAIIINWLVFGTTLSFVQLIGASLLILGSVVLQYKKY